MHRTNLGVKEGTECFSKPYGNLKNVLSVTETLILSRGSTLTQTIPGLRAEQLGNNKSVCREWVSCLDCVCVHTVCIICELQQRSLVTRKGRDEQRGDEFSSSIMQIHLGHKVASTPGLVHGSICLILNTRKRIISKTVVSIWSDSIYSGLTNGLKGTTLRGAYPTCCPPTLGKLHAGCCSLPPHWQTNCTRTLQCPEIHTSDRRKRLIVARAPEE